MSLFNQSPLRNSLFLMAGLAASATLASADVAIDSTSATGTVTVQGGGGASPVPGNDAANSLTYDATAAINANADTGLQDATDGLGNLRGSARGTGTAIVNASLVGNTLSGSGSCVSHFEANPDLGIGQGIANASFGIEFRVLGSATPFSMQANMTADFESPDQIQLRRMDSGPLGSIVVLCNNIIPNVNTSGTLQPGIYRLFGNIGTQVSGGSAQSPGDEGVGYNYALSFDLATTIVLQPAPPGSAFCFGDGAGTACPCNDGTSGRGCPNSATSGAQLQGTGVASFLNDSFALFASRLPANKIGLCIKGSNQLVGGNGNLVGDGLLCTSPQLRSQVITSDNRGNLLMDNWRGQGFGSFTGAANPGSTTYYQWWYRDPVGGCTAAGFNFTNAWSVDWSN